VGIPAFQLSTQEARGVLPEQVSRADAVFNVSRAGLLVAAFATGQLSVISQAIRDRFHQPYRMQLVPGLAEIIAGAQKEGALGAALSGAGPSVVVLSEGKHPHIGEWVKQIFAEYGIDAHTHCFQPIVEGAQVLAAQR
jgi:homoserine kinase